MMGLRDSLLDVSWNESVTGYWKVFTGFFLTYIYILPHAFSFHSSRKAELRWYLNSYLLP